MRLARLQHNLLLAIANGEAFSAATLSAFNAGTSHILAGGREATDAELLALENLIDQTLSPSEGGVGMLGLSSSTANTVLSSSGDLETQSESGDGSPEAGGAPAPSEPESVTAVAPPEASPEAPAEPPVPEEEAEPSAPEGDQLTEAPAEPLQDEGDLLTEAQPDPLAARDELFQSQPHDEDDGA